MKKIIAALFVSVALMGAADAEKVTGVLGSFDQMDGTIVLKNGKSYGVSQSSDDTSVIHPIANGSPVVLTVDAGSGLVSDIRTTN